MNKQICKNCTFYHAYYEKFGSCYGKKSYGYCRNKNFECKETKQNETCEFYLNNEQKEKSRSKRLLKDLERAAKAIDEMSQIIKEKAAEEKK